MKKSKHTLYNNKNDVQLPYPLMGFAPLINTIKLTIVVDLMWAYEN
jgi:hypothetical protein